MGQVAFDTLQALEELEITGISREQARAILLVVHRSHEVADVATKADITEVNRNVADIRKYIVQIDKRLDFSEKRFYRLEIKFDRLQWFLLAGILSLLFKDLMPKLWGG